MSTLQFPPSPTVGQEYTFEGKTWRWTGTGWILIKLMVTSLNGLTGDVILQAGDNVTITLLTGNVIEIASSGGGGEFDTILTDANGDVLCDADGNVLSEV